MVVFCLLALFPVTAPEANAPSLRQARDHQDRAALARIAAQRSDAAAKTPNDASAQYSAALAASYAAEVAQELHDKSAAYAAAVAGMPFAERAVALKPDSSEYNRVLGALCGQAISGNSLAALKYGKCALENVNKAIELDPKSSEAYLSQGVGYFYLPPAFGGGVDTALKDFQKAIQLNPRSAEAYIWLGVALRKSNRPAEARKAFEKALELNPNRLWARQQLDKTPRS
jgi:tetratricopeptide (TPR) repeat protein